MDDEGTKVFHNDDQAYEQWVAQHGGFVLTAPRKGEHMLHNAACTHLGKSHDPMPEKVTVGEIKALTVRQPWAHMIAYGGKTIENRVWETRHRGLLAIHAGSGWDRDAEHSSLVREAWTAWASSVAEPAILAMPLNRKNPGITLGAVIAVVDSSGCHRSDGDGCPQTTRVTSPEADGVTMPISAGSSSGRRRWRRRRDGPGEGRGPACGRCR